MERMLTNAQTRHIKEEEMKKEREDKFSSAPETPKYPETSQFTFDKSDLPPVILSQIPDQMRADTGQETSRLLMETRMIQNLIASYFDLVKKNIADLVPKTIMAFLVNESRKIA